MTAPAAVPTNPLQRVPEKVRAIAYWSGWILGNVSHITTIIWVSIAAALPEVSQPVWLIIATAVLGFVQTQLHALAAGNLPAYHDVDQPRRRRRRN